MIAFFLLPLFFLYYTYHGYLLLLRVAKTCKNIKGKPKHHFRSCDTPRSVSVLVTAHNEEGVIEKRISNILRNAYEGMDLQVVIASDQSTDRTDELVANYPDERVVLFRPKQSFGKTDTQNKAMKIITGEVCFFTDSETTFSDEFLREAVGAFSDPKVGCVDGHLNFSTEKSGLADEQSRYWQSELEIRALESELGILAKASGACLGFRKDIFSEMPTISGDDTVIPLLAVCGGFKVTHVSSAFAYDTPRATSRSEFSSRVRMTARNWLGVWSYSALLNPIKSPGYAFSIWSHRIMRWLSPFFGIWLFLLSAAYSFHHIEALVSLIAFICLFGLGFIGLISEVLGHRLPIVKTAYAFLLANSGFFVGVFVALLRKHKVISYRNE